MAMNTKFILMIPMIKDINSEKIFIQNDIRKTLKLDIIIVNFTLIVKQLKSPHIKCFVGCKNLKK